MSLSGKTIFITGASRGIGLAMGLRAARDGANIVIAAKTIEEHPKLPGTIFTAAEEMKKAGGQALPLQCDVRSEEEVEAAIAEAVKTFGGLDILINNASAISLTKTADTAMKRYDLMQQVNARATFLCSKIALPHLKKAANPHILNISPPLNMSPRWFGSHVAYTTSKYGMSMCTLGMAEELKGDGIAVNSLWPETAIDTAAIRNLLGGEEAAKHSRVPDIMADAAYIIFNRPARTCTGNFFVDSEVLKESGVADLDRYAVIAGSRLMPDFFLGE